MPYRPAPVPSLTRAGFRRAVREAASGAAIARESAAVPRDPDGRPRPTNQRLAWNRWPATMPRLSNGRAGNLTPAQRQQLRHDART
ncbi:hypothetical protein O7626_09780 [Micromonospora sp. WMMD1102]|uniref:hypothetical protein n=1 Tax=Micromonospora sp. WMMD1102 TaxID=3016105 RepID=UPI00241523DD|nr:hypothetical protein [Micromonospora sp. WMMD1102]MDG4786212.1 hypothetical protein [Micromonospora sp. WMMD1102]